MKGRLVALRWAAVLAVYTAGYARTRSAAEMLEAEERRPPMPRPDSVDRTPIPPAPAPAAESGAPSAHTPEPAVSSAADRRAPAASPENRRDAPTVIAVTAAAAAGSRTPAVASNVAAASAGAREGTSPAAAREAPPRTDVAARPAIGGQSEATIAAAAPSTSTAAPVPVASAPVAPLSVGEAAPAPLPSETPVAPPAPAAPKWKDGHYTGWGTSRHGDIQASVFIENGRIATASIAQCLTRYPCDWIVKLPPQVVQRQSAETDYVSGATESTNAFYYAVLEALGKAGR